MIRALKPPAHLIASLFLCTNFIAAPAAHAIGPLGWFIVDQAFSRLPTPFVGQQLTINGTLDPRITLLMYQQTQAAAGVLNQEFPLDLGDNLAAMRANALGAGLLEIELIVMDTSGANLSPAVVDTRWGTELRTQICQGAFFTSWMNRGGSLQFAIKGKDQVLARQYYANALNCAL